MMGSNFQTYALGEKVRFQIPTPTAVPISVAMINAAQLAANTFGATPDGGLNNVPDFNRFSDQMRVAFDGLHMVVDVIGPCFLYYFIAWAERKDGDVQTGETDGG